jgi:flagellar hook protein FlgE
MVGALWTGISGLQSHQKALDNESSNIANVNTVGYKSSRISFSDQMYQDKIGKGSKVLAAEKMFTQGNLKNTGVSYDMALSGDGFFTVKNTSTNGSSELLYTRAGNFKMGENGTLQDAAGNEIQGWAMSTITDSDIQTTNPEQKVFNKYYSKLGGTKIVQLATSIETITAKMTDYTKTVKSDNAVFTGFRNKTDAAKMADIQALATEYSARLDAYAADPDAKSSPSIAQVSAINFPDGTNSQLKQAGDQIYVVINGNKISQEFISVTAGNQTDGATAMDQTNLDLNGDTVVGDIADENLLASRIATFKALADKISETIPGFEASVVAEADGDNTLEADDTFTEWTKNINDAANNSVAADRDGKSAFGIIQIKSLIPGQEFTIGDVAEVAGGATRLGESLTMVKHQLGTGFAAVSDASKALKLAVAGSQRSVLNGFTNGVIAAGAADQIKLTIYDPSLGKSTTVPQDATAANVGVDGFEVAVGNSIDTVVANWNANSELAKYTKAENINNELVITTKDDYVGYDYNLIFKQTKMSVDEDKSGYDGGGAEYLEIKTTVNQAGSKGSLQLQLDKLNISDSAFGEFEVDSSGVISMKQDGARYAIGQVAVALFSDKRGLDPQGDNLLAATAESGDPIYNLNNEKTAKVEGSQLELSTADLSESLVNLMVFQRAFEANAKSITTSDQILNTLINLKRS